MPRELSKCRNWEKERRNRLAESFSKLEKLLPSYNPSQTLSKIEILTKAATHIEELQIKVKNCLTSDTENKTEHAEIKQLYRRVNHLVTRNQQLTSLFRDAGISLPKGCGSLKMGTTKKWSQKITPAKAAEVAKLEAQKENEPESTKPKISPKKRPVTKAKPLLKQKFKKTNAKPNGLLHKNNRRIIITGNINPQQNLVTVTNIQPFYYIAGNQSSCLTTNVTNSTATVVTNSTLLSAPILSTIVKAPVVISKTNTIPTGTIIFMNNIPHRLFNSPIILNAQPTNTVIVTKNKKSAPENVKITSNKSSTVPSKPLQTVLPKRSITSTTHVNKVPIPASRYASSYILVSKVPAVSATKPRVPARKTCVKVVKKMKEAVQVKRKCKDTGGSPELKKSKIVVDDKETDVPDEVKKTSASDYSIDAICKEKESGEVPEEIVATKVDKVNEPQEKIIEKPVNETPKKLEDPPEKTKSVESTLEIANSLGHSELSNDIFASLQVPTGGQNPESTSPTAAFLNAFPLVSSFTGVKVTEVIEDETSESRHGTPTLLQIGTMDTAKTTQTPSESLMPSLLSLDNFSFFSSKEICNNLYNAFESVVTSTVTPITTSSKVVKDINVNTKTAKILYDNAVSETECVKPACQEVAKISTVVTNVGHKVEKIGLQTVVTVASYTVTNSCAPSFYTNSQIINTSVAQVSVDVANYVDNKNKINEKASCSRYTSYNIPEYNTFNPFTDPPKSTVACNYISTKTYTQPTYTNNNCNYNYQPEFNSNYPVKNVTKGDKYYNMNYESYDNQYNYYNPANLKPNKTKTNENVAPRPPVNWMTTPDLKQQNSDFVVPTFAKDAEFVPVYTQNNFTTNSQTTYFNSSAPIYSTTDFHNTFADTKKLDTQFNSNTFQRNDVEENQFTWSPTKLPQLLDPSHSFVATTLPTLVGDLALGNTQYVDKSKVKKDRRSNNQHFDVGSNFLSVSQLVDHNKPETAARITARRNSGGRSKPTTPKSNKRVVKPLENKEPIISANYSKTNDKVKNIVFNDPSSEWMVETKRVKNPPSSYSAEALIGHPSQTGSNVMSKQRPQQQSYSKSLSVSSFLPDNLITYFPPVDMQDNNFTQQNQNYQNNAFTHSFPSSMQNNSYSGTFIPNSTTTYLSSSNFEIADYNPMIPDNLFSHSNPSKVPDNKQFTKIQTTKPPIAKQLFPNNTTPKKSNKKKPSTENAPGFVDFSFLSMPGTINSPILPDDFHTHSNFLPPPNPNQLYPCKNPLYPKQSGDLGASLLPIPSVTRSNIQHSDVSPLNTVGTSLTNFNLSTIFPEINKSTTDMYLETPKNKDYSLQRSYLPATSQIPTFSKAPIYSSITTQSFTNS